MRLKNPVALVLLFSPSTVPIKAVCLNNKSCDPQQLIVDFLVLLHLRFVAAILREVEGGLIGNKQSYRDRSEHLIILSIEIKVLLLRRIVSFSYRGLQEGWSDGSRRWRNTFIACILSLSCRLISGVLVLSAKSCPFGRQTQGVLAGPVLAIREVLATGRNWKYYRCYQPINTHRLIRYCCSFSIYLLTLSIFRVQRLLLPPNSKRSLRFKQKLR